MAKPTDVFCIHEREPEILAYAMAKYSRSALSMRESLAEISSQKAGEFLNSFYFAYGHKSIADMAHVAMALESVSMIAAIEIESEARWDGQERSTRYQDFSQRHYITPPDLSLTAQDIFDRAMEVAFDGYDRLLTGAHAMYLEQLPKPADMKANAYERTISARAFDVARYMLPMATQTSVGQITSARTLESQITRMLASPYGEVRALAGKMKEAALAPAFGTDGEAPPQSPTLVKYTKPSEYQLQAGTVGQSIAHRVLGSTPHWGRKSPVSLSAKMTPDVEVIATVIYEVVPHSFAQIVSLVEGLSQAERRECIAEIVAHRGRFDELAHTWRVGAGVCFDIRMDIGGFRDFHRHRRCTQIYKEYAAPTVTQFQVPEPIRNSPLMQQDYASSVMALDELRQKLRCELVGSDIDYLLPLGASHDFLLKMDVAELAYITELRTGPAGHFSYRRIAWDMYKAFASSNPTLAEHFRVTDVDAPVDLLMR